MINYCDEGRYHPLVMRFEKEYRKYYSKKDMEQLDADLGIREMEVWREAVAPDNVLIERIMLEKWSMNRDGIYRSYHDIRLLAMVVPHLLDRVERLLVLL